MKQLTLTQYLKKFIYYKFVGNIINIIYIIWIVKKEKMIRLKFSKR
jgi:hypothetical protein